jgi:adenosylcobinamide kinase / adenosylcobinamide-phosphate guanylyltransferase
VAGSKLLCIKTLPKFTLVLGGARSGKSSFAEGLVIESCLPRRYIATAQAWDSEMRVRIAQHREQRGENWVTIEAPLDLAAALQAAKPEEAVLVDCATLWLSNHLLADADLDAESAKLLGAIANCAAPIVVVSNEVGWSIVPDNALARAFRDSQGRLNQQMAAQADLVVAVIAGLPIVLKGQLPDSAK